MRSPTVWRTALRAIALLLLLAPSAPAQGAPTDSAIRRWITDRVNNGHATGIVVGRRVDGRDRVVAFGGAERSGAPLGSETYFEIGSITKVFTNILLADMVLKGEVALEDPVAKYLPATVKMPSRGGKEITLLDLATASSGLPRLPSNLAPKDVRNPYADYTVQQLYDFLSSHSLRRDPGSLYEYSNLGMGLLGHVLALRAGKPYEALLTERVLAPLGMKHSVITLPAAEMAHVAVPHNGDLDEDYLWDLPTFAGAGALRSTTRDMLRFAEAVTRPSTSAIGKAIAFSIEPRRPTTNPSMRIALGWHVREQNGQRIVWHNGGTGGFRTFFGFDPATGANVMVWSNTSNGVDDIGLHLLDSTVALLPTPPQPDVQLSAETLQSYVGEYPLAPTAVITVREIGGKLYAQLTGQSQFRLWAESANSFYLKVVAAKVTFERDTAGAMALTLDQGGQKQRAVRR